MDGGSSKHVEPYSGGLVSGFRVRCIPSGRISCRIYSQPRLLFVRYAQTLLWPSCESLAWASGRRILLPRSRPAKTKKLTGNL